MRLLNFLKLTEAKLRGPHQKKELELMLSGTKPFALVDLSLRDPEERAGWEDAVRTGKLIHKRGPIASKRHVSDYFALPGEEWRMDKVAEIFYRVQATDEMPDEVHRTLGELLGYSDEAIDHFINVPHTQDTRMSEAPVRDFEVDPSVNQYYHGTWNRRDQAMLNQPKMKEIATRRIKTAIPIDMHFAGLIQMDRGAKWMSSTSDRAGKMTDAFRTFLQDQSGVVPPGYAYENWGIHIAAKRDAISVLYLSNTNDADSAIPITPWMMTHRLGHSLQDAANAGQLGTEARGAEDLLTNSIVVGMDDDEDSILKQTISPFLTMKSARQTKVDEGEEIPEMIAQYLYSGKVTLARAVLPSGKKMIRLTNGLFPHIEIADVDEFNVLIEQEEQRINQLIGVIVKGAVGLLVVAP